MSAEHDVVQTSASADAERQLWELAIERRLDSGSKRMRAIEAEVAENTAITREVRDLLQLGRNGLRILGYLGTAAKWVCSLIAAGGAAWGVVTASRTAPAPPTPGPVATVVEPARPPVNRQEQR